MKNNTHLSIPKPCSEDWEQMQPDQRGRFCAACQKTVIDFSLMNDEEVISYFQNTKNTVCGRLTDHQLALNIPVKSYPLFNFKKINKYIAASFITLAGMNGKTSGQENSAIHPTVQTNPEQLSAKTKPSDSSITIAGQVLDKNGDALIGARVTILHTNLGTMADIDGNFKLTVAADSSQKYLTLEIEHPGYPTKRKELNIFSLPNSVTIRYTEGPTYLGEVVVKKATNWDRFKWWFKDNFL